jgi:hypothetical protein
MLECLFKGWNIFWKKNTLVSIIFSLISIFYTYFNYDFIVTSISEITLENLNFSNVGNTLFYIIKYLDYKFYLIIILIFINIFLIFYNTYIISLNNSKKIFKFKDIFNYSLLFFLVTVTLAIINILLIYNLSLLTILLLIITTLFFLVLILISNISVILLALNEKNTLKIAIKKAWIFIKEKFWLYVVFIILINITMSIIYYIIDLIYYLLFGYLLTAMIIMYVLYMLITILYSINSLKLFIKKYSIK